jgi:multiple sugar transport system substrate-binding protein
MGKLKASIIAIAVVASVGVGISGCSSGSANASSDSSGCQPSRGKVTLDYWGWQDHGKAAVEEFNKTHKNIQVKYNALASGNVAYQNYFDALKAGNQPDVAMIEYDHLANFRAQNDLTNIAGCAPVKNLKKAVVPWTYSQVTLGGNDLYATPLDTAPLALYYRTDIFKQYGLTVPKTWADYMADAQKLKSENPAIAMTTFAPQDGPGVLTGLIWQAGAEPYSYQGSKFVIDMHSAPIQKVADYWQQMIDKGLVNTSIEPLTPAQYKGWSDGTIATAIGAVWEQDIMKTNAASASGKWAVAELPQWTAGDSAGGNWGGSTTAVLKGTKHPYEAAVFADWLATNPDASKAIYQNSGTGSSIQYSNSGALDTPQPYYNNQKTLQVFQKMSEGTNHNFAWSPDQTNLNGYISDALTGAFNGSSTVLKSLEAAQAEAVADLKSQSIPVVSK